MPEYTGAALKPVHFKMSATQKEIDKGKSYSCNRTEYYHRRYYCDGQFDHKHHHGTKRYLDVGDHDFVFGVYHRYSLLIKRYLL